MFHPRARLMLAFALPAIIIGVLSSLILVAIMMLAGALQTLLWQNIPAVLNVNTQSASWTLFMLTLTGVGVGALIKYMPGPRGAGSGDRIADRRAGCSQFTDRSGVSLNARAGRGRQSRS